MSRRVVTIEPDGWPCTLAECPPGHFMWGHSLCCKSEYKTEAGRIEAFNEAGEVFWGETTTEELRSALIVQPVTACIHEDE